MDDVNGRIVLAALAQAGVAEVRGQRRHNHRIVGG